MAFLPNRSSRPQHDKRLVTPSIFYKHNPLNPIKTHITPADCWNQVQYRKMRTFLISHWNTGRPSLAALGRTSRRDLSSSLRACVWRAFGGDGEGARDRRCSVLLDEAGRRALGVVLDSWLRLDRWWWSEGFVAWRLRESEDLIAGAREKRTCFLDVIGSWIGIAWSADGMLRAGEITLRGYSIV